jgi:hypothetical protein
MKLIYELIITGMETLGLLFVAFGLGVLASWWAGAAGFLLVTGLGLLAAAGLSASRQRPGRKPKPGPGPPPVTKSKPPAQPAANGTDPSWVARLKKVMTP